MVHPHTSTQLFTDNTTSYRIDNGKIKQHQPRAMNTQYLWIRDQKTLKKKPLYGKQDKKMLMTIFKSIILKNHNKHVPLIYLNTDKTPRSVPLVLIEPALQECVYPKDSNKEGLRKTFSITQIS